VDLICGINPVIEALSAATRHFDRILVVKGLRNRRVSEAIGRATRMGIPLRFEGRETLDRMAGGVPHQGLIAVVSAKAATTLETVLADARTPGLVVVLDGVEDPRNMGAILRTCEAAGADGVLLPDRHSAGLSETVARASAGALEHVRVARIGNVASALETLKAAGYWVVGFDAAGGERWDAIDYGRPVALVLGGEGRGIRRLVRDRCDHLASLPLFGHVSSLNVSVAAGVALYEVIRQRRAQPSHVRPIPPRPSVAARGIVGPSVDDTEADPGRTEPAAITYGEDEGDELDPTLSIVQIHEEAAWAGPTVLKPVAFRHGRGRPHGEHRREPAAGARAPQAAHGPPQPPQRGEGEGRENGGARRRRRRRRRPGEPPVSARSGDVAPDQGSVKSGGAPGEPQNARRRRRRRRR
jgi:23S rRNA (guanosine2251-2'-O)-methyltransferase